MALSKPHSLFTCTKAIAYPHRILPYIIGKLRHVSDERQNCEQFIDVSISFSIADFSLQKQ